MLLPNLTSPPFAASLAPPKRARPERGLGLERRLLHSGAPVEGAGCLDLPRSPGGMGPECWG
jgi:hypothetical protein